MEIVVISRETIKPSFPTPNHLRHVQLSFLDQINSPSFMSKIYFYSSKPDTTRDVKSETLQRTDRLKKSLSETLTRYYPLAGRVKEDRYIECNDAGVVYVEAEAKCKLSQFLAQPDVSSKLNNLLPFRLDDVGHDLLLAIQVNVFDCGGIAISVCSSHQFADGLSLVTFVNNWAAAGREDNGNVFSPCFNMATLFPPKDISGFDRNIAVSKEKMVSKSFVFTTSAISALGAKYAIQPTRTEALSTFIWSRYIVAIGKSTTNSQRLHTVVQAVNLRSRMNPPLPQASYGNLSRFAVAFPSLDSNEEGFGLVTQMREAVSKIDSNYVKQLQDHGDEHLKFLKGRAKQFSAGEIVSFRFTSLVSFPLYEADFGWGSPIWVTKATIPTRNLIVFLPTRSGKGVEAWINMTQEDMAKLEADKEIVKFVSATPGTKVLLPSSL